jgi:hypothetical protein
VSSNCSLVTEERAERLIDGGLRMVGTDFCADTALYEHLRVKAERQETLGGIRRFLRPGEDARTDFRCVIKDMATHGRAPAEAKALMGQTQALASEWPGRVMVMPVYFHIALDESLVNLSGPAAMAAKETIYTLCHQPWVNFTVDFGVLGVGALAGRMQLV